MPDLYNILWSLLDTPLDTLAKDLIIIILWSTPWSCTFLLSSWGSCLFWVHFFLTTYFLHVLLVDTVVEKLLYVWNWKSWLFSISSKYCSKKWTVPPLVYLCLLVFFMGRQKTTIDTFNICLEIFTSRSWKSFYFSSYLNNNFSTSSISTELGCPFL